MQRLAEMWRQAPWTIKAYAALEIASFPFAFATRSLGYATTTRSGVGSLFFSFVISAFFHLRALP